MVGDNVEIGVYPIRKANEIAEELKLDLVEISPNANPPVCKIIDYKKFLYEQKKREKALKNKYIKYREAYEKKANRTETQIKKCETEREKLLKDNLKPKIYKQYLELEKALDGLYSCLDEHNFKAHTPLEFL